MDFHNQDHAFLLVVMSGFGSGLGFCGSGRGQSLGRQNIEPGLSAGAKCAVDIRVEFVLRRPRQHFQPNDHLHLDGSIN